MHEHIRFMNQAMLLAEQAAREDEVPVGAVLVKNNEIHGKGYNQIERLQDPTAHAEMLAITAATESLGTKHLKGCTLYVTLEPCAMCAGAIVLSRVERIVFGALEPKTGACGSIFNIVQNQNLNHQVQIIQGVMENECEELLTNYFKSKRNF
jgi:tRNA(adenine34) deaminase